MQSTKIQVKLDPVAVATDFIEPVIRNLIGTFDPERVRVDFCDGINCVYVLPPYDNRHIAITQKLKEDFIRDWAIKSIATIQPAFAGTVPAGWVLRTYLNLTAGNWYPITVDMWAATPDDTAGT